MRALDYNIFLSTGEKIQVVELEYQEDMDPEILDLCGRMSRATLEEVKVGDDFQFRKQLKGAPDRNLIRCRGRLCSETPYCTMKTGDCVPGQFKKGKSLLPICYNAPDEFYSICIHAWREDKYVIVVG